MILDKLPTQSSFPEFKSTPAETQAPSKAGHSLTEGEKHLIDRLFSSVSAKRQSRPAVVLSPATITSLTDGLDAPRASRVIQLFGGRDTVATAVQALQVAQKVAKRAVR